MNRFVFVIVSLCFARSDVLVFQNVETTFVTTEGDVKVVTLPPVPSVNVTVVDATDVTLRANGTTNRHIALNLLGDTAVLINSHGLENTTMAVCTHTNSTLVVVDFGESMTLHSRCGNVKVIAVTVTDAPGVRNGTGVTLRSVRAGDLQKSPLALGAERAVRALRRVVSECATAARRGWAHRHTVVCHLCIFWFRLKSAVESSLGLAAATDICEGSYIPRSVCSVVLHTGHSLGLKYFYDEHKAERLFCQSACAA